MLLEDLLQELLQVDQLEAQLEVLLEVLLEDQLVVQLEWEDGHGLMVLNHGLSTCQATILLSHHAQF